MAARSPSPDSLPPWADVDAAITAEADAAFELLARLVRAPSTVGREADAQEIVAGELTRLGFEVHQVPTPAETAAVAPAGVAQASYAGRPNVVGASMARAHAAAHGEKPRQVVLGATMDARYYLNQFGRPALAYGPVARNIHAADEAVQLASIVRGARTLARFIASYYAEGGLARQARPVSEVMHD